eukprot:1869298-Rhodomonas_salina.2
MSVPRAAHGTIRYASTEHRPAASAGIRYGIAERKHTLSQYRTSPITCSRVDSGRTPLHTGPIPPGRSIELSASHSVRPTGHRLAPA